MTSTLYTNIGELVTNTPELTNISESDLRTPDEKPLGLRRNAAVLVEDGKVAWVGDAVSRETKNADEVVDLEGRTVIPGFVDSHNHLVFDGDRAAEFAARMTGAKYDGGGIANTVNATRAASDDELRALVAKRVEEARREGTTHVEIKSGYGLTVDDEVRDLKIAREFTEDTTFLGAHVVPPEADRREYVDLVKGDMLKACAPYAKWIDVFCEPHSAHAFDGDETREILEAGVAAGLLPRLHGGQLGYGPGAQLAVEFNAGSVDHCTYLSDDDIAALAGSDTVATLLPGVEFSTHSPYPDGGKLIDAGVTVALATDCNPGTCYSNSIPFMIAMAVREMNMSPAQALWGTTQGGGQALRNPDLGVIAPGKPAGLAVIDAPSYLHLCYRPGVPLASAL